MTSYQNLKALLADNQWHKISDWMKDGDCFIGYKAGARMSELRRSEPDLIETKKVGRFMYYRLKQGQLELIK